MPKAFVLINVESGSEEEAIKDLRAINGVTESFTSYGVYDIIAKVQANTMDELKDLITLKIRNLSKVRSTLTLILAEE
ncbi:MAG: Lrp/AsnC family transcriptional regulator [Candidatus Bathyarchaeia archaeon]|jgi:DNA-binding Lrp family transcriptional regulator